MLQQRRYVSNLEQLAKDLVPVLGQVPILRAICFISTQSNRLHVHVWLITWRFAGMVI